MKFDQDLRLNLRYDFGKMNSTLGSVVPLAMFLFLGHIIAILGAVYHLRHVLSIFGALNLSRPFVLKGYAENLLFALFFLKSSNVYYFS